MVKKNKNNKSLFSSEILNDEWFYESFELRFLTYVFFYAFYHPCVNGFVEDISIIRGRTDYYPLGQ